MTSLQSRVAPPNISAILASLSLAVIYLSAGSQAVTPLDLRVFLHRIYTAALNDLQRINKRHWLIQTDYLAYILADQLLRPIQLLDILRNQRYRVSLTSNAYNQKIGGQRPGPPWPCQGTVNNQLLGQGYKGRAPGVEEGSGRCAYDC